MNTHKKSAAEKKTTHKESADHKKSHKKSGNTVAKHKSVSSFLRQNKQTLPKFVSSGVTNIKTKAGHIKENPTAYLPLEKIVGDKDNLNSISSVFNTDHEHIKAIKRVFRKSLLFMILNIVSFGVLVSFSLLPFSINPLLTFGAAITYIIVTNIFFVIVADRSYFLISLLANILLFLLITVIALKSISVVTIVAGLVVALFTYLAYLELEKNQLGSRIFTITQIANESSKALWTLVFFIVSIGLFSYIQSVGTEKAFDKHILDNSMVFDNVVMGEGSPVSLNRFFVNEGLKNTKGDLTFGGFLAANYIDGKPVVSTSEQDEIILKCENEAGIGKCGNAILEERERRLNKFKNENYFDIGLELDSVLDEDDYKDVLKQYYRNSWSEFANNDEERPDGELGRILNLLPSALLIDRTLAVPAGLSVVLFVLLMFIKPILLIVSTIFLWFVWKVLSLFKFVRIEVETVEAEVVSI